MTAAIDSHRRCPRCLKRLALSTGQHDDRGDIETVHACLECDYSERQSNRVRRQSVPSSLRKRLDALRLAERPAPLDLGAQFSRTPPEVWGCKDEFRLHTFRWVGDGQWECLECGDQVYESEVEADHG